MKIWHVSDTHCNELLLPIPESIDMVIHSGDASNYREVDRNKFEIFDFLDWYEKLDIKTKIFVAGNHDVSIEKRIFRKHHFEDRGIIYLENEHIILEGLKIFGSPITPEFGVGWAWNRKRDKIHKTWDLIEEDTDVIITHGPPKSFLDISVRGYDGEVELCGCSNLRSQIQNRLRKTKLVCFGHIHGNSSFDNHGVLYRDGIYYSNGSTVRDGRMGQIHHTGNLFNWDGKNISIWQ